MRSPPIVITKEFFGLLISQAGVYQYQAFTIFYKKASGRYVYHVIAIGRIGLCPEGFRYHPKHGASI
jgi:hypothetical protein